MGLKEWADKNKPGGSAMLANKAERAASRETLKADFRATKAEHAAKKAERAGKWVARPETFEGITLTPDSLKYGQQGGSIAGATARVETAADARRRITATRVLAIGIFALAAKKQAGSVYLTVEHPEYEFVVEIPVKKETQARAFAAKINNAAKHAA